MAYLTVEVDSEQVLQLLKTNHGLTVGDAVGRADVEFEHPIGNGRQVVKVELSYALTPAEIDSLR